MAGARVAAALAKSDLSPDSTESFSGVVTSRQTATGPEQSRAEQESSIRKTHGRKCGREWRLPGNAIRCQPVQVPR